MLAHALFHHEGALRASLMKEYGVRLAAARTEMTAVELADLVVWLPAGSPFWRAFGGPAALSSEEHALRAVGFKVDVLTWVTRGAKGRKPQKPETPPYAHEVRERDKKNRRKAEALMSRRS